MHDIHRRTAAILFGVTYEAVTPEQRERAKVVDFFNLFSDYQMRIKTDSPGPMRDDLHDVAERLFSVQAHEVTKGMIKLLRTTYIYLAPPAEEGWPNCPDCKQPVTGIYRGVPGCSRCGWSRNGSKNNRSSLV